MATVPNYRTLIARYTSSRQWDRVLHTARQWLAVEPENVKAHRAAGEALVALHREAEAERHIRHVLTARPDDEVSHGLMSDIHFSAGRFEAAEESFRKAVSLNPGNANHWYDFALKCHRRGDHAFAKECAAKALELNPRDPDIINLAITSEEPDSSNVREKLAQYRKALELDPTNARIHSSIGGCYLYIIEDYEAAEDCFRRALFFDPSNKFARENLFTALKFRDPIYSALHALKERLPDVLSFLMPSPPKDSLLLILLWLPVAWFLIAVGLTLLGLWYLFVWPLVKAYESLTIGDIHSEAGEVGAKRGGLAGYRRWSLKVRLGIFAAFLAAFWGGIGWLLFKKHIVSAGHGWIALFGISLFFGLIIFLREMLGRRVRRSRSESHARRRAKKFGTLLEPGRKPQPQRESEEAERSPDEEPAEKPVVVETEPVRFRPDWADFP